VVSLVSHLSSVAPDVSLVVLQNPKSNDGALWRQYSSPVILISFRMALLCHRISSGREWLPPAYL
jgi:hypothetical protein